VAATLAATFARRSTRQLYEGQGRIGKKIFFIYMYVCEGKDEAMASGRVIFQSVAGRESGVIF